MLGKVGSKKDMVVMVTVCLHLPIIYLVVIIIIFFTGLSQACNVILSDIKLHHTLLNLCILFV